MKKLFLILSPILLLTLLFLLTLVFPFQRIATTMVIRELTNDGSRADLNSRVNAYLSVGSRDNSQLVGSAVDLIDADGQNLVIVRTSMEATNISHLNALNIEAWITSAPDGISVWKQGTTVVEDAILRWSHEEISLMVLIMRRDGRTDQEIRQVVSEMQVNVLFHNRLLRGKQSISLNEIQLVQPS